MTNERLQKWIEQGNVTISQLFFHHYHRIPLTDLEAMVILHLLSFQEKGQYFPTPDEIANRMAISATEVSNHLQRLMQKGVLHLFQKTDESAKYYEEYSLAPLWTRLLDCLEENRIEQEEKSGELKSGELYAIFEQEFGRLISPMESEQISKWVDEDHHSTEVIYAALREAVLAQKCSFRYIDRILFNWKKKGVHNLQDVEKQVQQFRTVQTSPNQVQTTSTNHAPVKLYNWLEIREK